MQVLYERCCGLDVHKKTVVACVLITSADGQVHKQVRTAATTTAGLLALADWLAALQISHVALESTGIYWRPVFNLLEEGHTIILVNARHMKAVPGRKTDIKDAEWIAELLRHGLLKASFIPSKPTRDLRDLVRYRKTLVQERAQEINRLHKVLETANIKLSSVVSDVLGKSGRRMLAAMIEGVSDAEALADLARGTLRHKLPQLQQALRGQVQPHHQVLLGQIFAHISYLEHSIQQLQREIEQRLCPFEEAMQLLLSIPGIQEIAAAAILAEIGVDMSRFPSAKHLARLRRGVSRQQTKRRQTSLRQDHQGQRPLALRADRSRLEHQSYERQLSLGSVSSFSPATGQTESRHGGGPQLARHHLPYLE